MNETYKPNQTNQKPNHKGRKIAGGIVLIGLATLYGKGVYNNTQELSDKLTPLKEEFVAIANTKSERDTNLDYDGQLKKIANVKNEFAADNHTYSRVWNTKVNNSDNLFAYIIHGSDRVTKTPTPLALNPLKRKDNNVDASAIKKYFMDTYGKNYKKRIEQVHKAMGTYNKN
jgi:hypothetical protein